MRIAISSAHGLHVRGAKGLIDEVDESRRMMPVVAENLRLAGHQAVTFNDDVSRNQRANLDRIIAWHNGQQRDIDCSLHFNAHSLTPRPMGTETLYVTAHELARRVSRAIADASGLRDRGGKHRGNLAFLRRTSRPAVMLEVCFVDSEADVRLYRENFETVCRAIAEALV